MTNQDEQLSKIAKGVDEIKEAVSGLKGGSTTGWQKVAMLVVVVGALVGAVIYIANKYGNANEAATILGIVVPVFATIGAAVFGIQIAYDKGEKKAEEEAQDKINSAEQDKAAAEKQATEALQDAEQAKGQAIRIARVADRLIGVTHERSGAIEFAVDRHQPGNDPLTELRTLADQILSSQQTLADTWRDRIAGWATSDALPLITSDLWRFGCWARLRSSAITGRSRSRLRCR